MKSWFSIAIAVALLCSCSNDFYQSIEPSQSIITSSGPMYHDIQKKLSVPEKDSYENTPSNEQMQPDENIKLYPIEIYEQPLSESLTSPDECGWMELLPQKYEINYGDTPIQPRTRDGIYWLDENRAFFFEPWHLKFINLKDKTVNTIASIHSKVIANHYKEDGYDENAWERGEEVEHFICNFSYKGFVIRDDGLFFNKNNDIVSFATFFNAGTAGYWNFGDIYTFSAKDLSYIGKDKGEILHPEYCVFYATLDGNVLSDVFDFSKDYRETYIYNIFDEKLEKKPVDFDKEYIYYNFAQSPSGKYFAFVKDKDVNIIYDYESLFVEDAVPPEYVSIFDSDGNLVNEYKFDCEDGEAETFYSGYNAAYKFGKSEFYLWDVGDLIKKNGEFIYPDGTPADKNIKYCMREDDTGEYYNLFYRNNDGSEELIKEKVAPILGSYPDNITFNPSFTACVWRIDGKIGANQWELP